MQVRTETSQLNAGIARSLNQRKAMTSPTPKRRGIKEETTW
jgi:hypothetical protein